MNSHTDKQPRICSFGEGGVVIGTLSTYTYTPTFHIPQPSQFYKIQVPWKALQIRSVAQQCPTLCDPMNRSTPGLPVHHHLPEFTQTHVHRVSDAIQPSHPLSSPSPPAPIYLTLNVINFFVSCTIVTLEFFSYTCR